MNPILKFPRSLSVLLLLSLHTLPAILGDASPSPPGSVIGGARNYLRWRAVSKALPGTHSYIHLAVKASGAPTNRCSRRLSSCAQLLSLCRRQSRGRYFCHCTAV
ncbi:hypothetical protein IW262DRAFT_278911 [Armillaria fumosa]|nr:hypothetical protein IW262DRAFT_278911 [Armillaria fumosa]